MRSFVQAVTLAWSNRLVVLARFVGNIGRFLTGVDIHPGAKIGKWLVIDHAIGVVIGETAEIADNVTLYHNVTLGGIAPAVESKAQKDVKRHPTLLEGSIVGSGAQVLAPSPWAATPVLGPMRWWSRMWPRVARWWVSPLSQCHRRPVRLRAFRPMARRPRIFRSGEKIDHGDDSTRSARCVCGSKNWNATLKNGWKCIPHVGGRFRHAQSARSRPR